MEKEKIRKKEKEGEKKEKGERRRKKEEKKEKEKKKGEREKEGKGGTLENIVESASGAHASAWAERLPGPRRAKRGKGGRAVFEAQADSVSGASLLIYQILGLQKHHLQAWTI